MESQKFVKVANRNIYLNPRFIVKFEFNNFEGIGEAVLCMNGEWERENVYRKDIEHLIHE
jgi:hypothetical protein